MSEVIDLVAKAVHQVRGHPPGGQGFTPGQRSLTHGGQGCTPGQRPSTWWPRLYTRSEVIHPVAKAVHQVRGHPPGGQGCTPAKSPFHWLPGIVHLVIKVVHQVRDHSPCGQFCMYTRSEITHLVVRAVYTPGQRLFTWWPVPGHSFTGWVGLYNRSEIIHLVAKAVHKPEVIHLMGKDVSTSQEECQPTA
jgi:hypothetical protein